MTKLWTLLILGALASAAFANGSHGSHGSHGGDDEGGVHHHNHHYYGSVHHNYHRSGEDSSSSEEDEKSSEDQDDRAYQFQVGEEDGAYEYIDTDGHVRGFHIDLILDVCRHAGKRCYYVLDSFNNCWNTQGAYEVGGVGLLDRWYDGCIGLFPTPSRYNVFNFTVPFTTNFETALIYRAGEAPKSPDLTGLNVGFLDGWPSNKLCLGRQSHIVGNTVAAENTRTYQTHEVIADALVAKEIDVAVAMKVFDLDALTKYGLEEGAGSFDCTTGGASVMTRYGSVVLDWWNEAFESMVASGEYKLSCERARRNHGSRGPIHCLP